MSRIIATFFTIAAFTGYNHVSWNMQTGAQSIHSIKVLNDDLRLAQIGQAVGTPIGKM